MIPAMGRKKKQRGKAAGSGRITSPETVDRLFETAQAYEAAGRMDDAETVYRQILGQVPNDARALFHLGSLLARTGQTERAIAPLKKAAEAAPDVAAVQLNLGNLYYLSGRMKEALAAFHRARELAPDTPDVHAGLASVHHRLGQPEGAILALRRAVELAPDRADLATNLASALNRQGRTDLAVAVLEGAAARMPENEVLAHQLAALSGRTTSTAPASFVEQTFDRLSSKFDSHLKDDLGYRTPESLYELMTAVFPDPKVFDHMVDLGCGTGLSGLAFQTLARRITGIDLSAKMLQQAREKGIYHDLQRSGIVEALTANETAFDLFVAADVLVYVGDLAPLFHAAGQRAAAGALFLFSTESTESEKDWELRPTGRYAHSRAYVERLCRETGWHNLSHRRENIRKEKGAWIEGDLYLTQKAADVP